MIFDFLVYIKLSVFFNGLFVIKNKIRIFVEI